jgi:hypothetical protein
MAIRIEPVAISMAPNSGKNAAKARGPIPNTILAMPTMIASIAIIVTPSGRNFAELFPVLFQYLINNF